MKNSIKTSQKTGSSIIFANKQNIFMKKLFLITVLSLLGLNSFAQTKVGTIDADFILTQLPEMTEVNEGLKEYNEQLQKELETSARKYETLVKDYQANNATFTEDQKKEKEAEIIELENDLKSFRQKATVMMQMKRNELTQPLYEKINTAMMQVIEEEKLTHVLHAGGNNIAFAAEEFDITNKVMDKMGIQLKK